MTEAETLLSQKDVAKVAGVCHQTMHRIIKKGEGPPYLMVGKRRRYKREDILGWMQECATLDRAARRYKALHQRELEEQALKARQAKGMAAAQARQKKSKT